MKDLINPFNRQVDGDHYSNTIDQAEFCIKNGVRSAESNVIKYMMRHHRKGGINDLRKAQHYIEMIAYCDYGENL